jgi:hypothetical protein
MERVTIKEQTLEELYQTPENTLESKLYRLPKNTQLTLLVEVFYSRRSHLLPVLSLM